MIPSNKRIIAGNWKMNGSLNLLKEIIGIETIVNNAKCDVVICPPNVLLGEALSLVKGTRTIVGAQNCHHKVSGAHTGEISAAMLKDIGISLVILGHSERRTDNFETNDLINSKVVAAHNSGLTTIICIGETAEEKANGKTNKIIEEQLTKSLPITASKNNTMVAYEPIWAIGTGKLPSSTEIMNAHLFIRGILARVKPDSEASKIRILYGGSVNPKNCLEILSIKGVDGALVGGASLKASDFGEIIKCVNLIVQ